MSSLFDFDAPSFAEVVAYLSGVSDGVTAHSRAARPGGCGASPAWSGCPRRFAPRMTPPRLCGCDDVGFSPPTRVTLPYKRREGEASSLWPVAVISIAPWGGDTRSVEPPSTSGRPTLPYSSRASSFGPEARSGICGVGSSIPVGEPGDRPSGVTLKAVPLSHEWYELTGTNDGKP